MSKSLKKWLDEDVAKVKDRSINYLSSYFFHRDPQRIMAQDTSYFFSPADGIIINQFKSIGPNEPLVEVKGIKYTVQDLLQDETIDFNCLIVDVFMTFYDVHINRVPYPGFRYHEQISSIKSYNYPMLDVEKGLLGGVVNPAAGIKYLQNNSRVVNEFYSPKLKDSYFVVQIGDFDVDTIVSFNGDEQGEIFKQNQRFGLIRYGSQCSLIIPESPFFDFELTQEIGNHVESAIDTLVKIKKR